MMEVRNSCPIKMKNYRIDTAYQVNMKSEAFNCPIEQCENNLKTSIEPNTNRVIE